MEKNTFEQQVGKIESLVNDLIQANLKGNFIASKVKEYSENRLKPDKTVISRIKNGDWKFTNSQDLLPLWIDVLERIKLESGNSTNFDVLVGNYIGYYFDNDKQDLRLLLINICEKNIHLSSEYYQYTGKCRVFSDSIILEMKSKDDNPVMLYSNLDGALSYKVHIEAVVFHYVFRDGRGIESGECIFFYLENTQIDVKQVERSVFKNHKELYPELYQKASNFFQTPKILTTNRSIFEFDELK